VPEVKTRRFSFNVPKEEENSCGPRGIRERKKSGGWPLNFGRIESAEEKGMISTSFRSYPHREGKKRGGREPSLYPPHVSST